jgi:glycosyltransferase involved in cell wall biosynthesis
VHIITGLEGGGAEGVLYRLVLNDADNTHTIISLIGGGRFGPLLREAGFAVYCLGMVRGRPSLRAFLQLFRLLRRLSPDVVQTWMYHADLMGGIAARFAGVRYVCWGIRNSNLDPVSSTRTTIRVANICAFLSRWVPTRIICCSERAARVHHDMGYMPGKFRVIPNGYDLAEFAPSPALRAATRGELGIGQEDILVGMIARLDPQKDHANLFTALKQVASAGHNFFCILAGTGMERSNFSLIRQFEGSPCSDRMLLLGRREDIPALMNVMDINVLSSSFGEAFPNVLAEAMACGTPCVTTDVGDAASIVGDAGWVVPPRQSEMLAEAIMAAIYEQRDRDKWLQRQTACRARVEKNYSISAMVAAYNLVWKEQAN